MIMAKNLEIFLDSADINAIKSVDLIHIDGITTNPSLAAKNIKSGEDKFEKYKLILAEIANYIQGPISAEVIATDYENMLVEAFDFTAISNNIIIKLPCTRDGLRACKTLTSDHNLRTNMTLCFSSAQATIAAINGATYISPFVGRIDDIGLDGIELIRDIKIIYDQYQFKTKILAASVRTMNHVIAVLKLGVGAITMSPALLESLYTHPLTDKGMEIFAKDWNK